MPLSISKIRNSATEATLQLGSSIYLWLTVDSAKLPTDSTRAIIDTIPRHKLRTATVS